MAKEKRTVRKKLHIPDKEKKRSKGYYISDDCINFIKAESKRLSDKSKKPVSENEVLMAIIAFYRGG